MNNRFERELFIERNRIERIVIKDLFGELNYDIDLRNGQDISILIAPNGCGKTTIFKFIDFIFNPTFEKYKEISRIDFIHFDCYFSSDQYVSLQKIINKDAPLEPSTFYKNKGSMFKFDNMNEYLNCAEAFDYWDSRDLPFTDETVAVRTTYLECKTKETRKRINIDEMFCHYHYEPNPKLEYYERMELDNLLDTLMI